MSSLLYSSFLAVCLLLFIHVADGHVYVQGSRGVFPNNAAFFDADAISPCANGTMMATNYINVTKGNNFPINWGLIVNHNNPPLPAGVVSFYYVSGLLVAPPANITQIATNVSISTQPNNQYYTQQVVIPAIPGYASIQVVYNINGAPGPFPTYYQCLDIYIS